MRNFSHGVRQVFHFYARANRPNAQFLTHTKEVRMPLNEADTRAQLIDPQINRSGWTRSQITREHCYKTDWS